MSDDQNEARGGRLDLTAAEFRALFEELSNWGRWGKQDQRGAEREQGVTVAEGDILLVRTGHARRCAELDPWDTP